MWGGCGPCPHQRQHRSAWTHPSAPHPTPPLMHAPRWPAHKAGLCAWGRAPTIPSACRRLSLRSCRAWPGRRAVPPPRHTTGGWGGGKCRQAARCLAWLRPSGLCVCVTHAAGRCVGLRVAVGCLRWRACAGCCHAHPHPQDRHVSISCIACARMWCRSSCARTRTYTHTHPHARSTPVGMWPSASASIAPPWSGQSPRSATTTPACCRWVGGWVGWGGKGAGGCQRAAHTHSAAPRCRQACVQGGEGGLGLVLCTALRVVQHVCGCFFAWSRLEHRCGAGRPRRSSCKIAQAPYTAL